MSHLTVTPLWRNIDRFSHFLIVPVPSALTDRSRCVLERLRQWRYSNRGAHGWRPDLCSRLLPYVWCGSYSHRSHVEGGYETRGSRGWRTGEGYVAGSMKVLHITGNWHDGRVSSRRRGCPASWTVGRFGYNRHGFVAAVNHGFDRRLRHNPGLLRLMGRD